MFKDHKYSLISITHIKSFFRFLLLSTSNVRMSEGTFCRVEVHIFSKQILLTRGVLGTILGGVVPFIDGVHNNGLTGGLLKAEV